MKPPFVDWTVKVPVASALLLGAALYVPSNAVARNSVYSAVVLIPKRPVSIWKRSSGPFQAPND